MYTMANDLTICLKFYRQIVKCLNKFVISKNRIKYKKPDKKIYMFADRFPSYKCRKMKKERMFAERF